MRFSMEDTAAIVVDYQEKLVPVMEGKGGAYCRI